MVTGSQSAKHFSGDRMADGSLQFALYRVLTVCSYNSGIIAGSVLSFMEPGACLDLHIVRAYRGTKKSEGA